MVPDLEPQLAVLGREASFTLEELAANRQGKLHPEQIRRGRPGAGGFVFWLLVGLMVLCGGFGGAFAFYESLRKPVERVDLNAVYAIAIGSSLLGLGCLALAFGTLRSTLASQQVYAQGTCTPWDITFEFTERDKTFSDFFYVSRGGERLLIPKNVARVMRTGVRYRLYVVERRLLALEPLE